MLFPNYALINTNPGKQIGGITDPTVWRRNSSNMKYYSGEASVSGETEKASFPVGYNAPAAWCLAPKAGGMSSHNQTTVTSSQTANLVGGLPASGSTSITFTQTATGGLIVSGSGSASITFSATGTILSIAAGSGSATITLSGNALIGALAGLFGTSNITLTPTATIKAIGYLSGLSTSETEFSAAALAQAVWEALAVDYQTAGSMGEKMNSAGSAGDPWTTILPGSYTTGTAGEMLTLIKRLLANNLIKVGDTVTIKTDDGTGTFKEFTSTATERTEI